MTPAESAELGSVLHRLVPAIKVATGVQRVYYLAVMERAPHFHLWLVPRKNEGELRGVAYLAQQPPLTSPYSAAQHQLPIVYVVMRNNEYSILKSFAVLEDTPGVPGLDLPGLGIASVARGFGCRTADAGTAEELEREFKTALSAGTPTVIVVSTQPQNAML